MNDYFDGNNMKTVDKKYFRLDTNATKDPTAIGPNGTYSPDSYKITSYDKTTAESKENSEIQEASNEQKILSDKINESDFSSKSSKNINDIKKLELIEEVARNNGIELPKEVNEENLKKMKVFQDALKEFEEKQQRYLVRGAMMRCSCGSHHRRLNLPKCHGAYTNDRPIMNDRDSLAGDNLNIPTFGVCKSGANKTGGSILLKSDVPRDSYGKPTGKEPKEENVKGTPCSPIIVTTWLCPYKTVKIGDDLAITEQSFLVCKYNGIIEVVDSGQYDKETLPPKE